MTRRDLLLTAAMATAARPSAQTPLILPVRRVMDIRTKCTPERLSHFWWRIWPEAVQNFNRCGIQLQCTDAKGEIKLSPGDRPIFAGLERGVINLVLTDRLPMFWDQARSLAGMTTIYEGYHLCVIALSYAHGNQFPFLSVNTCVHEMLHLLLQDVFVKRPKWYQASERETRDDWYATRLWLFHDGAAIRRSAAVYLERLRLGAGVSTTKPPSGASNGLGAPQGAIMSTGARSL
jgi:hypothetical protein